MRISILLPFALFFVSLSLLLSSSLLPDSLPSMLLWVLFFICIISALAGLSFILAGTQEFPRTQRTYTITPLPHQPAMMKGKLPIVPRTINEVLTTMTWEEFEVFSAAVIIALGQGHSFERHCGGSGDQGVDVRLRNLYGQRVVVQSKFYAADSSVGSEMLREFAGSILYYQAVYGFFVTTSRFTSDAQQVIHASSQIRAIDGAQLETYLQRRSQEIARAWAEVLDQIERDKHGDSGAKVA